MTINRNLANLASAVVSTGGDLATANLSGTITNSQLAGSITSDKLAGSITSDKISSITSSHVTTALGFTPGTGSVTSVNGQTGAITNTTFDSIGSCAILVSAQTSDTAVGATIAGSSLRYNLSSLNTGTGGSLAFGYIFQNSNVYNGGGTSVTGTWRKMSGGPNYVAVVSCNDTYYYWMAALWVRVS